MVQHENCCRSPGNAVIHDFDVKIINNTTFVFMSGRVGRRVGFLKHVI